MPKKDKEARNKYVRDWKRKKREELGLPKRGKHTRKPRTEEEIKQSKINRKTYEKQYALVHPWKEIPVAIRLLRNARSRSKLNDIEFNITLEDICIPTHCPYLGIELTSSNPKGSSRRNSASLDRIDPTKGYIKGNIQVISHLANTMKNDAPKDLLVAFANSVLKLHG